MKRFLIFISLLLCIATSCERSGSDSKGGQLLHLNISSEPPSLDSRIANDTTSANIISMLFEGLMLRNQKGELEPAIAKEVIVSEDKKTYTFKLKDTVWSNGDPVTASDFERAWKWILNPANGSTTAINFYPIKNAKAVNEGKASLDSLGIKVIDPKTLVVELEHPTPYFLELTSLMYFFPVHAASKPDTMITNGPFDLTLWKHNDKIIVKKNPHYWDASAVRLSEIVIYMVADSNTELNMFEEGEIDWAGLPLSLGVPTDAIQALAKSGKLHILPDAAVYFYAFNTEVPVLNNANIRKAIAYAVNRHAIVENITQAKQIPAVSFIPPLMGLRDNDYFQDQDVAKAKELFQKGLAELNMRAEDFPTLKISYNTSEGHHKIAQAIQQQLLEGLGIKTSLENEEWKVYLDKLHNHQFELGRLGWKGTFNDPMTFLDTFKYKTGTSNPTGWQDPKYTELLDKADNEIDIKKRDAYMQQAEAILMDQMPIMPIYFHSVVFLKNPDLKGVIIHHLGDVDFRWAYFEVSE